MGKQEDLVAAVKDQDLSTILKLIGKVAKSSKRAFYSKKTAVGVRLLLAPNFPPSRFEIMPLS